MPQCLPLVDLNVEVMECVTQPGLNYVLNPGSQVRVRLWNLMDQAKWLRGGSVEKALFPCGKLGFCYKNKGTRILGRYKEYIHFRTLLSFIGDYFSNALINLPT